MPVKAVDMVRKIRDQHYEATKDRSVAEQIRFVKKKSAKLQKQLERPRRGTAEHERLAGSRR
jgi:hypothetical protein